MRVASTMDRIGFACTLLDEPAEGRPYLRRSLERQRLVYAENPANILVSREMFYVLSDLTHANEFPKHRAPMCRYASEAAKIVNGSISKTRETPTVLEFLRLFAYNLCIPTVLVTGASRGVGRGVATQLAADGFHVFATGRTIDSAVLPPSVHRIPCDHTRDSDTAAAFEQIEATGHGLDVLVNSAWGGYERMVDGGQFTWALPFWQQPAHRWAGMMDAGVRAAFFASAHAARIMTAQRRGLIVNISYWAAQRHLGNVLYGISKAATDKMTADMAHELRDHHVNVVSLYPGLVRTESVLAAAEAGWLDLANSESPEFIGKVIAAMQTDRSLHDKSGSVIVAAQYAQDHRITDIDGNSPTPLTLGALTRYK